VQSRVLGPWSSLIAPAADAANYGHYAGLVHSPGTHFPRVKGKYPGNVLNGRNLPAIIPNSRSLTDVIVKFFTLK